MYFLIVLCLGVFIGYKFRGAVEIYRQVKQVKYIEKIVERIMSEKEIKVVNFQKRKEDLAK